MRDPKRIKEFCDKLAEIWEKNVPDWRFVQVMENILGLSNPSAPFLFYAEDEEILEGIKTYFNVRKKEDTK